MRVIVMISLFLVMIMPAYAQDDESLSWRVVVSHNGWLYTLTPTGIQETLAEVIYPPLQLSDYTTTVMNGDWFAVRAGEAIIVGDLSAPTTCCTIYPDPMLYLIPDALETSLLGITADGGFLLLGDVIQDGAGVSSGSGVTLFALGDDPRSVDGYSVARENASLESLGWIEDQLQMVVNCHYCTHGDLITELLIYMHIANGDGTFSWNFRSHPRSFQQSYAYLPATSELLALVSDSAYPLNQAEGPVQFPNVLSYHPDETSAAIVLYHDAENLSLAKPHWVMNGKAYLYAIEETLMLIRRDGSMEPVVYEDVSSTIFLSGTPTGWLVMEVDSGRVLHYTAATEFVALGTLTAEFYPRVVDATPLGSGIELPPLQPVVTPAD